MGVRKITKNCEVTVGGKEEPSKEAEEGGQRCGRETTREDSHKPVSRAFQEGGRSHEPKAPKKSSKLIHHLDDCIMGTGCIMRFFQDTRKGLLSFP